MKILKSFFWFLTLLPMTTFAQEKAGSLRYITEITVKQGHEAQFLEGTKLWKACYLKNKGTDHWELWRRVQGKGIVYELTGEMANWAEMDKTDPASMACRDIFDNFITPNVESAGLTISQNIPGLNAAEESGIKVMELTFFRVKNRTDFMDVVKSVSSAIKTSEGKLRGYWYRIIGGGPDGPSYFVAEPYKGFADLDKPQESPFKVYEKVNGKKAGDALMAKADSTIVDAWSYLYTLNEDASN